MLPVDKPVGPTSHDVVGTVRKVLDTRKVGHTGTLDPFASGLLLVCVGPATRLSEYLTGLEKSYRATLRLGVRTDTHDPEGTVVEETAAWSVLDRDAVEAALEPFRGRIRQRPPVYSAKKVAGEPAHRRVRRGESVDLDPVEVEVLELVLEALELPDVRLRVRCSSGTYVRALARDVGEALGTGAHLTALRRTAVGAFRVEEAVPLTELDRDAACRAWISPVRALAHLPRVEVDEADATRLAQGQFIEGRGAPPIGPVAVVRGDTLVAVATARGSRLRPRKVFA